MCVCVCVCMDVREKERKKKKIQKEAVSHWLFLHVEIGPRELVMLRSDEFIEILCLVCHGIGVLSFSWL